MAGSESLSDRIKRVNATIERKNKERQINIGKRETLLNQLNDAISEYKDRYGVLLTEANIEDELNRVLLQKQAEIDNIEKVLNLIDAGEFEEATRLVNLGADNAVSSGGGSVVEGSVIDSMASDSEVASVKVEGGNDGYDLPSVMEVEEMPDLGSPPEFGLPEGVIGSSVRGTQALSEGYDQGCDGVTGGTASSAGEEVTGTPDSVRKKISDFSAILSGSAFGSR